MTKKIGLMMVNECAIFSATLGITYYANVVKVGTTVTTHIYGDAAHTTQGETTSLYTGNKTCGSSTTSVIDGYIENLKVISVG